MADEPFSLGHCLGCDMAAAINAWKASGRVTPSDLLSTLVDALAQAVVHSAEEGKSIILGHSLVGDFAKRIAFHEASDRMDKASPHAAGNG